MAGEVPLSCQRRTAVSLRFARPGVPFISRLETARTVCLAGLRSACPRCFHVVKQRPASARGQPVLTACPAAVGLGRPCSCPDRQAPPGPWPCPPAPREASACRPAARPPSLFLPLHNSEAASARGPARPGHYPTVTPASDPRIFYAYSMLWIGPRGSAFGCFHAVIGCRSAGPRTGVGESAAFYTESTPCQARHVLGAASNVTSSPSAAQGVTGRAPGVASGT